MKARAINSKRRVREREARALRRPDAERERFWSELQPLLDQELHALAEKYRIPILMCDLQGRSRKEAAQKLGWPEGTVATRLTTGRTLLAKRLARHGLTLPGATLAIVVAEHAASAAVPASLVISTVRAANAIAAGNAVAAALIAPGVVALTDAVLKGTALTRFKTATAGLIMIALLGVGSTPGESNSQPAISVTKLEIETEATRDRPQHEPAEQPNHAARPLSEKGEDELPPAKSAQVPPRNPLDNLLVDWEKAMTEWQTFAAEVQRITWRTDKSAGVFSGTTPFLQGHGETSTRASLHVWRSDRDELHYSMQYLPGLTRVGPSPETYGYERYLRNETGSFLYVSAPAKKVLRVQNLPPSVPGEIAGDNFLGFIFDMRAADAKKRFQVTYIGTSPDQPDKYHRLKIVPLEAQDRADLTEARLVLNADSLLPRQLWFRRPDGATVTWNFLKADANVEVPISEFVPPPLPDGWTLEQVPGKKSDSPSVLR